MRILVDLADTHIRSLDAMAKGAKQSRAALIRDAVSEYLSRRRPREPSDAFGLWSSQGIDGLAYQKKIRAEW